LRGFSVLDVKLAGKITRSPLMEVEHEIDEAEALGMAQRVAAAREQTVGMRGSMKATREAILAYLVGIDQTALTMGNTLFEVKESPEPIRPADLYAETLRRHYGWKEPAIDEFFELAAETKEDMSEMRTVLSIRNKKRNKKTPAADDAPGGLVAAVADVNGDEKVAAAAAGHLVPMTDATPSIPETGPTNSPVAGVVLNASVDEVGARPRERPSRQASAAHAPPSLPRAPSHPPPPPAKKAKRAPRKAGAPVDIYDEKMDVTLAAAGITEAPDAASRLFLGPLPRIIKNLQDAAAAAIATPPS